MKGKIEKLKAAVIMIGFVAAINGIALGQKTPTAETSKQMTPAQALTKYEQQLQADDDEKNVFYLTTSMASAALKAGDTEKAKSYAQTLLKQAETMREDWNYGNAIHVGNLVLGRIALASGDVAEAKRFFLESGKTPGSPQLNTFGPNMLLAKELLAKEERDVVLQYLDLCAKFWKPKDDRLEDWKETIKKGEMPDFKTNLVYQLD